MGKAWGFIENRLRHSLKLKADSVTGSFTAIYGNFLNVTKKLKHEKLKLKAYSVTDSATDSLTIIYRKALKLY